ncbi:hypothetical protein [Siansivirga zeaxanthinifaciens]|uniref:hypothetical protein n=1 Tax=Siansivirga zeaxanthinifaciens TaxID=762954 RepID=UPI0012B5FDCF|nr:hypothetical protein [Siansivirga zeaxanthinifaciens]
MKVFLLIFCFLIGIFYLTNKPKEPAVIKLAESPNKKNCIVPSASNDSLNIHQGCCISSSRSAYIMQQIKK